MLILILANCLIGTLLAQEVHRLISSNHTHNYLLRQLYVLRIAQTARYIDLANSEVIASTGIPLYRAQMQDAAVSCRAIQRELEAETQAGELRRSVLTWEDMEGEVVMTRASLPDAINRLIDKAVSLQGLSDSNLTLSHPGLFYLYRNGLGETLDAAKASLFNYVSDSKENIKRTASATYILFLPFILVLMVTSIFSICNLRRIQGKVREISHMLGKVSAGVWKEQRRVVVDRLISVHGEEIEVQDRSGSDSKPGLVLFNAFLPGFSIILLFFAISLTWYMVEYNVLVSQISHKMLLWPDIVETAGSQVSNTLGMWTWMLESFLLAMPGLSQLQGPAHRAGAEPEFERLYWSNRGSNLQLLERLAKGDFSLSQSDFNLLYQSTNYSSAYLRKGYHAGFNLYQEDAKMIAYSSDLLTNRPIVVGLYTCSEALVNARTEIYDLYSHEITYMIERDVDLLVLLVILHTVIVVVGLGFGVFRVIHSTDRQVKALWRSLRLLPSDSQTTQPTKSQFTLDLKPTL